SFFFFSSRRRHTRFSRDWSSDVCSSDLRPNKSSVSVKKYAASLSVKDWKFITVRRQSGSKKLQAWFHSREVYILNPLTNRRQLRSEERRVGKECRSRWQQYG